MNQPDNHLANINNPTLTNLPSITSDHQNVQYPVQNMQRSFYPMASHLLPNMTLWHVPHPATVTSSHPQQVQQQVLQTNLNKPVVSYSSGGTTYYNQNPFSAATFIGHHNPSSSLPVQHGLYSNPMLPYATMPANTTGPFHSYHPSTSVAPAHDNSFNVKDLADAITSSQLNPLPKWTLAQNNGDPLLWHEWIGQFKIAIDSQNLSDAAKLTYLKTLLTGRAKKSIEQFAYSGALHNDAMKVLERKFGQPHAVVGAHLDKLNNYPPLKMHNSENVIAFASVISSLVGVFQSLSYDADLRRSSLLSQVVQKLPPNLKESWCSHIVKKQWLRPTLLEFNDWLQEKADTHDRMKAVKFKTKTDETPVVNKTKTTSKAFASNSKVADAKQKNPSTRNGNELGCPHCKANHPIWKCPKFKSENPTQRAKIVAEHRLCFSCLNGSHQFRNCPNPRKCKQPGCTSTHNILLHGSERIFTKNNAKKPSETKSVTDPPQSTSLVTLNSENICTPNQDGNSSSFPAVSDVKGLLQVKEVQLKGPTAKETKVLALCDPACSHSWIAASAAARLNLKGSPLKLTVCRINAKQVIDTLITDVTVKPLGDNTCESFDVSPYIRDTLNVGSDIINVPQLQETYPYLSVLDPIQYSYSNVEMILGQDVYHAIRPIEYFESDSKCAPVAVRLPIGWVLSGPLPATSSFISSCFKIVTEPETDLAEQLKSWYDMESYGAVKEVDPRSSSDRRAVEILEKTTFNDGKRYQVGMLWSKDDLHLQNNYYSALVQLKSLEKRLFREQDLRVKYEKSIKDDVDKGYVVQVLNSKDPSERSTREWYLPHHPVVNPNKPNKMRRVLNGAAKFHGTSLNKSLLTGPDLLQRLIHTLIRFRQYQYAVSADIEGMFLQVGVLPQDQPCLRFLWREDPSTDVMVYQYTRHIFGAKDSPTCANYALQRTAKDNSRQYPDASQAVLEKFYMDDYLDSLDEPEKALKRAKELVELLTLGGFKLTKFVSSVPHLLDELDNSFKTNDQEEPKVIGSSEEEASSHVLGLKWDHKKDTLVVSRGTKYVDNKNVTQRLVLSLVSILWPNWVSSPLHSYRPTVAERYMEVEWSRLGQGAARWHDW